jgi:TonB family protein
MLRLLPVDDPDSEWSPGSFGLGTLATAVLFALTAAAGPARRPGLPQEVIRQVKYILPPKPGDMTHHQERLHWNAAVANGTGGGGLDEVRKTTSLKPGASQGPPPSTSAPEPAAAPDPEGGKVYVESELDKAAERDPASAAPAYPPLLEVQGIEGSATVQFVVDSDGRADSGSFSVLDATHPAFAVSVRTALVHMLFAPAEINGHHVRQWVQQTFQFVIQHPVKQVAASLRAPVHAAQ